MCFTWASLTHSWSWALLEKLPTVQTLKKFPAFYGTRRFITMLTRALHWFLSWARSIQSIPFHPSKSHICKIINQYKWTLLLQNLRLAIYMEYSKSCNQISGDCWGDNSEQVMEKQSCWIHHYFRVTAHQIFYIYFLFMFLWWSHCNIWWWHPFCIAYGSHYFWQQNEIAQFAAANYANKHF
jgi:hypothetical protein